MTPFRILSSGHPVGTILATDRDDALRVFVTGRGLPAAVDLAAYSISAHETRRPRAARGWRA